MRHWLVVPLFCSALLSQGLWQQRTPVNKPSPRSHPAMAYDTATQRVYLFSGNEQGTTSQPDLWQWDGTNWQSLTWGGVLGRRLACFCSDGAGGLLLFGGLTGSGGSQTFLGDTNRLVQGQWSYLPGPNPPARAYAAMVATSQGVILFGGIAGPSPYGTLVNDTWLWNGSWTQLALAASPPPRYLHAMAFDAARNVVVMFGGTLQGATQPTAETWELNGATWTLRPSAHVPPRRESHTMHYLPHLQKTVLLGGTMFSSAYASVTETWSWNGVDWTQEGGPGSAPERSRVGAAYDAARSIFVMFGGQGPSWPLLDDTFEYADMPASVTAFGVGCPGPTATVPALAGVPNEPPRLGTTARFRLTNLPTTLTVAMFVLGTSDSIDPGPPAYALPFDLAPLGWPGCQQLVANESAALVATVSGQGDHTIAIPPTFSLLSFTFFAQALVFYVPTGVAVSNALRAVVGT